MKVDRFDLPERGDVQHSCMAILLTWLERIGYGRPGDGRSLGPRL